MNNPRRIQRHLVKALAAGALLAAAALPMAIATSAGAVATTYSVVFSSSGSSNTGPGDSGTFSITASAATFAGDGGNATITSSIPGVTFSSLVDTDPAFETITGDYATAATATAGPATLTITDDAGTFTATNAITVDTGPTATSLSVTSMGDVPTAVLTPDTITGSGFFSEGTATHHNPVVTLTSTVNGTTLTSPAADVTAPAVYPGSSTLTFEVSPFNSVTGGPATPGTYTVTVTNPDGGTVTTGAIFTITGDEVTNVSPSSVPNTVSTSYSVTINGGGFETGATVYLYNTGTAITSPPAASNCTDGTLTATLSSADEFTGTLTTAAAVPNGTCDVYVLNGAAGDNGDGYDLVGAIGFGADASLVAPTITSSSLTTGTALTVGAPSTTVVLTGTGFGSNGVVSSTLDPAGVAGEATLTGCIADGAGTALTCNVFAGAALAGVEGNYTAVVNGGTLADAFTVGGPAITTIAPTALAIGAPIGTTIAITGTGFSPDTSGAVVDTGGDLLAGNFEYVSATSVNFVVTHSPSHATSVDTLAVTGVDAYGYSVSSAPVNLTIDNTPTVSSLTYATGTTGVGIGATAQKLVINGSNFATGATVGTFVNSSGVADPDVTATVTTVTATTITATIAIKTGDTNTIDGYTVSNTDGGATKVIGVAPLGLTIDAAPTITAVSPVTATPSSTNAFTITGTGFLAGAVVTPSSDGTCGTATVASATSITVSCTLGAASSTAVTLSVSNLDGGTAVSGTVLGSVAVAPSFHVTGAHGTAIAGKTSTLTISGTGFYGQPRITSTAAGTKVGVTKDTGKLLTIRVTTKAGVAGEHTFTITLANGKSGKANYSIKK
jgi:large repetitive protein